MDRSVEVASKGMFTRNVTLDDGGVRRGDTYLPWDRIDHYFYDLDDWRKRGRFILVGGNATPLIVDPIFDHWPLAAERILGTLHGRRRTSESFSPFRFHDGSALEYQGHAAVPLADIAHVELAALGFEVIVVVTLRDGREAARVDIGAIANVWMWFAALVAHGVGVRSELDFHLPPQLDGLTSALAAASQLPTAKLVR